MNRQSFVIVPILSVLFLSGCPDLVPDGTGGADAGHPDAGTGGAAGHAGTGGTGGTPACPANQKECNGTCVSTADPDTGCAETSCAPCAFPHSTAACSHFGTCTVVNCDDGWHNCNGMNSDGCETNINSDTNNCGGCGNVCPAGMGCMGGSCAPCFKSSDCGDGNPCTVDTCFDGLCVHTDPPSGTLCSVNGCAGTCLPSMANPDGGTIPPTCITPGC